VSFFNADVLIEWAVVALVNADQEYRSIRRFDIICHQSPVVSRFDKGIGVRNGLRVPSFHTVCILLESIRYHPGVFTGTPMIQLIGV